MTSSCLLTVTYGSPSTMILMITTLRITIFSSATTSDFFGLWLKRCNEFHELRSLNSQARANSMKPRSGSVERRRTRSRSPTRRPCPPRTTMPSAGGRRRGAEVPTGCPPGLHARHYRVERLAYVVAEHHGRGHLSHAPLDLARGRLHQVAVLGYRL